MLIVSDQKSESSGGTSLQLLFKTHICASTYTDCHTSTRELLNPVSVRLSNKDRSVNPSLHHCCRTQLHYDIRKHAETHLHTHIPEVNLAHLGRWAVRVQSIQSSPQYMVEFLFKKRQKTTTHKQIHSVNMMMMMMMAAVTNEHLHLQTHTKQTVVSRGI